MMVLIGLSFKQVVDFLLACVKQSYSNLRATNLALGFNPFRIGFMEQRNETQC